MTESENCLLLKYEDLVLDCTTHMESLAWIPVLPELGRKRHWGKVRHWKSVFPNYCDLCSLRESFSQKKQGRKWKRVISNVNFYAYPINTHMYIHPRGGERGELGEVQHRLVKGTETPLRLLKLNGSIHLCLSSVTCTLLLLRNGIILNSFIYSFKKFPS